MNRYAVRIAGIVLLAAGGCRGVITRETVSVSPTPPMVIQQSPSSLQNRFDENPAGPRDAVQDAVMWSEKYRQLSESADQLREKNTLLMEENSLLKQQLETVRAQLDQTRKELDDANQFLQKMHVELTQWKSDVLGFRDEIRRSEAAQMAALARILKVLGAEPIEIEPDLPKK